MTCPWGCDQGCEKYGEHLRNKGIRVAGCRDAVGGMDTTRQKKWDAELQSYRDARAQGVQPAGTTRAKVEQAMKLSDKHGKAFNADTGAFNG